MRLSGVALENFRNYEKISVRTDADLVLILGDNATGKTNFLESIYFLSQLKSFRAPDELLVRQLQDFFTLTGDLGEMKLEAVVQKSPVMRRGFKINGQKTKRALWQPFRTVLFVPNDLNLFILGPVARRKLLDEVLSQKSQVYAAALSSLDHVLKQKLALLEQLNQGLGNQGELDFWNEQMADAATIIVGFRQAFINFLNQKINSTNQSLTGFLVQLFVEYKHDAATDKAQFLIVLNNHRDAEIRAMKNLIGPQRDDFLIKKNQELNIYNSSRGELRAQILSLKLLQAEYLSDEVMKPIILLDDVFSELDETRRTKLIESLSGHQIFITSTEEHHLPKVASATRVLKVDNNQINE